MRQTFSWLMMAMTIAAFISLFPASLLAQSIWLDRNHDKTIALEILKPDFEGDDNTTFTTSVLFLSLRYPLAEKLHLVAELPFAHFDLSSDFGDFDAESTIGNPYLGLEISGENSPVFAELGIRAPVAPNENEKNGAASFLGLFTDFVDRAEAFAPDYLPITGMLNYRYKNPSGLAVRLRGGSTFWIYTGDEQGADDTELFLLYSAQIGYESEKFNLGGGFSGRWLVTEEDLDFGERTFHQLGFAASFGAGNVRPGVQIRLPLDKDLTEILDVVFGVNLGIQLE